MSLFNIVKAGLLATAIGLGVIYGGLILLQNPLLMAVAVVSYLYFYFR